MGKVGAKAKRKAKKTEAAEVAPADDNVARSSGMKLDLNRYTLERIIPGAVEMCDDGVLREKKLERDNRPWERKRYWLAEVEPGVFETTDPLPHGMPAMRFRPRNGNPLSGRDGAHWHYVQHLLRFRIVRTQEKALKLAREVDFQPVGGVDLTSIVRM
jgi:hypothetical protein